MEEQATSYKACLGRKHLIEVIIYCLHIGFTSSMASYVQNNKLICKACGAELAVIHTPSHIHAQKLEKVHPCGNANFINSWGSCGGGSRHTTLQWNQGMCHIQLSQQNISQNFMSKVFPFTVACFEKKM